MKKMYAVVLSLALVATLSACGSSPTTEIDGARAALDAAVSDGAEKYTADDLKAVNDQMAAAMNEVKAQDGKLFKKYDGARQLLVKVKADAEALKAKVATVKEEQKNAAAAALQEADKAVAEAKGMLADAPVGKGSLADIEMMKADVQALEAAVQEVQPLIENGDYSAASDKADAIKAKAGSITGEIRVAREKAAALKAAKPARKVAKAPALKVAKASVRKK